MVGDRQVSAVSDLLAKSRQAHLEYRQSIPHKASQGATLVTREGNPTMAREALQRAHDMRQQAHAEDPTRSDIAWTGEPFGADGVDLLLEFYSKQLAKA